MSCANCVSYCEQVTACGCNCHGAGAGFANIPLSPAVTIAQWNELSQRIAALEFQRDGDLRRMLEGSQELDKRWLRIEEVEKERNEALEEVKKLKTAIRWALGESPGSPGTRDFSDEHERRERREPRHHYWWRSTLRRLSGL